MKIIIIALASAKFAAAFLSTEPSMNETLYKRTPPVSFDCTDLPDICTSMCWGAYCTEPSFSTTLFFDNPTESKKSDRRTTAGCLPRPNRCSVNHNPPYPDKGYNCDEYPFASTSDADKGGQTNRCVPVSQNSAQGAIIRNWISNVCKCQPCSFIVGFGNPASPGVKYCSFTDRQTTCVPDSNTYKGLNPDVQPPAPSRKRGLAPYFAGGLYKTERGIDVSFAENLEPGTPIKHARLGSGGVHGLVKKKRDDCDPGDGDEWDSDPVARRERRSPTELVPEFEFIDDVIAYKIR